MFDEENEDYSEFDGRGTFAYLLLIDASKSMWEEQSDFIPIFRALDASVAMLRDAMISAPKHLFGISLYGVKEKDSNDQNILEVMKLKEPAVEDVKELERVKDQLRTRWGASDSASLLEAFRHCIRSFNGCNRKMRVKRVNLLSRMEEAPSVSLRDAVLKTAPDLGSIAVLNLIPIGSSSGDIHEFYTKLLAASSKSTLEDVVLPNAVTEICDILPTLWQQSHKSNASSIIKFNLGENVVVGAGIYRLCSTKQPLKKVQLERASNDVVITTRATNDVILAPTEERRTVLRSETCLYQEFGNERIVLSNEERRTLKKFSGIPSMTLLGFKSADLLNKERWYLEACSFLYPNDGLVEGSSLILSCLLERCRSRNKIALCILTSRWYSHPKLIALVPTQAAESTAETKANIQDGFHIVYLPYMENVRDVTIEGQSEPSREQVECLKGIIKKLKFKFNPGYFENPKLQKQYAAVESLALELSDPRPVVDTTEPDYEAQKDRIEHICEDFHSLFGSVTETKTDKVKSVRVSNVEAPDIQMLVSRMQTKQVEKYTVPMLKQIIKWKQPIKTPGLTGLKKGQLVELVYELCSDL